ncbi:MAG: hypothetical protein RMY62_016310 [Nostoc sp. ZfuVER08]|nr:hypothetical protein [Nostoc sp. ZfuVER08]
MKLDSQTSIISKQSALALDIRSIFWQQWQQYRDYLYRCCVKWMGGRLEQHDEEEWEGNSATVPHLLFLSSFQFSIPSQESVGDGNEGKFFLSQTSSKLLYSKGNFIEEFQKVSKKTSREIKAKRNELDFPLVRNPSLVIESGGGIQAEKNL